MPRTKHTQQSADLGGPAPVASMPTKAPTKVANLVTLLGREQGATLDELIEATGWLPHTARAALTGLRKKGHAIDRRKRDDVTCYHLPTADA